jgi:hypothetical protein
MARPQPTGRHSGTTVAGGGLAVTTFQERAFEIFLLGECAYPYAPDVAARLCMRRCRAFRQHWPRVWRIDGVRPRGCSPWARARRRTGFRAQRRRRLARRRAGWMV